ncbi:MAG: hypothetical protein JWR83_3087 [Aeromicrobium sp.]|nr:hypothetical protein [Aeromicrobium sp.]
MGDYTELSGLEHLYLEDSWVRGIEQTEASFTFTVDAVLTEDHPLWRPKLPGEQYSYLKIRLRWDSVEEVVWSTLRFDAALDASGTVDFGNIDAFSFEGVEYSIEGGWGQVQITSITGPTVEVVAA